MALLRKVTGLNHIQAVNTPLEELAVSKHKVVKLEPTGGWYGFNSEAEG